MRVNDIGIEDMQAQRRARRRTHYCADLTITQLSTMV